MQRGELVRKLELVSRALATNDLIPIFKCYQFDRHTVSAYNDSVAIVVGLQTKDAFAANGKILIDLLKYSSAENVTLDVKGHDLFVGAGQSQFKLPFHPEDEFLFKEPKLDGKPITITPNLIDGLSACLLTSGKSEDQRALMGVCLKVERNRNVLYSTDGDAISKFELGNAVMEAGSYMLPNDFCDALIKIVKDTGAVKGELSLSSEWVCADLDTGYSIFGRLVTIDNPIDYEAIINSTLKGSVSYLAIPEGLYYALARARVVADIESTGTILTVNSSDEGSVLRLSTNTNMGNIDDVVPMTAHAPVEANVSAELMQRCVSMTEEMAIFEHCCCFRKKDKSLFILVSNMGE